MRREDNRFLTGTGTYTADVAHPEALKCAFLRSDRPHARILAIDASAARVLPGIRFVLTGADLAPGELDEFVVACPDGDIAVPLVVPHRPVLARDRVCYVGEAVALIAADTLPLALDALEHIAVKYQDLPALTDPLAAAAPEAPSVHPDDERLAGNICFAMRHGNAVLTEAAFVQAAHRVAIEVRANRLVGHPLEPRGALAYWDEKRNTYRIALGHQGAQSMRAQLAQVLRVAEDRIDIETPDVGGAFGVKEPAYPEYLALLIAARRARRPMQWISTRSEAFLSEHHGRDVVQRAELALDVEGRFLALRFSFLSNLGAHIAKAGAFIAAFNPGRSMAGVYAFGAISGEVRCVLTHTPPVGPYRGAGRPEMAYVIERLVDEAAAATGIERLELRRRNLIRQFPHTTPHGVEYDSGNFAAVLERALQAARWQEFEVRRASSRAMGRLRGIGLACFLEATGGPAEEGAMLRFAADGTVRLLVATQSSGQGHETVFPAVAARLLGIPEACVHLEQGTHDFSLAGGSTIASRSLVAAGKAIHTACSLVIGKARSLAADRFEVGVDDVEFEGGQLRVAGTDRSMTLATLAAALTPSEGAHPLDTRSAVPVARSFPNGCHVAEVEIDPETGHTRLLAYTMVDDFGAVQNAVIVEGQMHGGAAQGVGQAMLEHCLFDTASGQLTTGSLMDYALPRADDLPAFVVLDEPSPSTVHPIGAKGAGEAGATGAPAAVANAVADALRGQHAALPDMPFSSEKIWRALNIKPR